MRGDRRIESPRRGQRGQRARELVDRTRDRAREPPARQPGHGERAERDQQQRPDRVLEDAGRGRVDRVERIDEQVAVPQQQRIGVLLAVQRDDRSTSGRVVSTAGVSVARRADRQRAGDDPAARRDQRAGARERRQLRRVVGVERRARAGGTPTTVSLDDQRRRRDAEDAAPAPRRTRSPAASSGRPIVRGQSPRRRPAAAITVPAGSTTATMSGWMRWAS